MRGYEKIILENVGIFFIVIDKGGKVIDCSVEAENHLGLKNAEGKCINEVGTLLPKEAWKTEQEEIEVVWEKGNFRNYFIFQSIPIEEGYILCFRREKPPKRLVTDLPFDYSIDEIPGIPEEVKKLARIGARSNVPVLIHGESGVGKEVLARAIHKEAGRSGNFVPVNCTSIPRDLAEAELFGYEPGAFTGADKKGRPGKFEIADNGTVFLDEIGDMPLELQGKLLRVIEDREIWRVGAIKGKKVDFKLVCATNADLKELVNKKAFREDLYYRITGVEIWLPPLRERIEYFDEFITYFLEKHKGDIIFSKEAMEALRSYSWPGNVRELERVIEFLIMMKEGSKDKIIGIEDLPEKMRKPEEKIPRTLSEKIEVLKKKEIRKALEKHKGNKTRAAKELGISRWGLIKMLKSLKME